MIDVGSDAEMVRKATQGGTTGPRKVRKKKERKEMIEKKNERGTGPAPPSFTGRLSITPVVLS